MSGPVRFNQTTYSITYSVLPLYCLLTAIFLAIMDTIINYVLLPTNFSLRLKIDALPDNHSFIFLLRDYEIMCVSFHLFLR